MYKTANKPMPFGALILVNGLLVAAALMMMTVAASADSAVDRSVGLSLRQWHEVDQMTNAATLASLGINIVQGVEAIEQQRATFPQTLRALRDGDEALGLEPPQSPDVLDRIARVEELWLRYDTAMTAVVHDLRWEPLVDVAKFEALFDVHVEIASAIDEMTEAFMRSRARLTTAYYRPSAPTIE